MHPGLVLIFSYDCECFKGKKNLVLDYRLCIFILFPSMWWLLVSSQSGVKISSSPLTVVVIPGAVTIPSD